MSKTPFESSAVRASAGALCLLLIATGTGFVPVAGLSPDAQEAPVVVPTRVPDVVTTPAVPTVYEVPAGPPARRSASAAQNGVTLNASLSHGQIVRGGDGSSYLHCNVSVDDAPRDAIRVPVNLVLVLDTSGSMVSAMPLLKRATLGIVERLERGDHLSIVTYSNGADVIYQGYPASAHGKTQAKLEAAVSGLIASGGTNISDGITAAKEALLGIAATSDESLPHSQRILLMTDGLANQGITDAGGLSALVTKLRSQSIALSALGLGSSYNEQLLGSLADAGGGAYHYVDRPEGLGAVYKAEVESLRALAARDAQLTITPASGVVVEEVVSWTRSDTPKGTVVRLGDLARGRSLKVVARLRLPTDSVSPAVHAVDVVLSFQDVKTREAVRCAADSLNVGLTEEAEVARKSENTAIKSDLEQIEVARQLEQARADALAGRHEEAKRRVKHLKELTGKARFSFEAPSGETRDMDFDELAEDMAEGESSERGRRANKMGDAAARAAGR